MCCDFDSDLFGFRQTNIHWAEFVRFGFRFTPQLRSRTGDLRLTEERLTEDGGSILTKGCLFFLSPTQQ
jgi:hypothetical protein